jgi:ribose transport system permease protein
VKLKKEIGIFVLLVVLCIITAIKNPNFLTPFNLSNLADYIGMYGIFSMGAGLVIITGGIDLSVGSMLALVGVLLAVFLGRWPTLWPLAALGAILLPMLLGWVHGWLITRMRIQPFIITLCGLLIYRGLARFIAKDATVGFGSAEGFETFRSLAKGKFLGLPAPFIMLIILAIIMWFVLHRSIYGRYLLAVGRNEEAVRFSGINTRRIIASTYVVAGFLTGISAIVIAFYTNSISPSNHGNFYELYGIAAAVLGGCSLRGGEGSIVGIIIGTALLRVLENLVTLLKIDSSLNFAVMGGVVLIGVLADQIIQNRSQKKRASH